MLKHLNKLTFLIPVAVFTITLIVYLITLAPTYLPPDGAEFALCIQSLGICHPTGFFPYILLGKLFTLLFPFGTLIYKINLLSAIYAAGTMLFLYLSLIKMGVNKKLSFLTVLVYAFGASMWNYSLSADIFTLGTLLLIITLYAVIMDKFYLSFLFFGLLTSHLPNSIILLPVLIWYWKKSGEKSIRLLVLGNAVSFLVLLIFNIALYLRMLQQPLIYWGHVSTLGDFFNYFTRKEFGGLFLIATKQAQFSVMNFFIQVWTYIETMFIQFGFILPLIASYGIIKNKLHRDSLVQYLIYSFILLGAFNLFSLSSLNPSVNTNFQYDKYYLSSFTILVLLFGIGLEKIKSASAYRYVLTSILLVIILFQLLVNFTPHNYSNNYFSQKMIKDSLSELPENAIAITITNQNFFEAWYDQVILNKYKNITLLYLPNNINTDYAKYHPDLLPNPTNVQQTITNETTNPLYQAILSIISQNPNRPIFIWQGLFENQILASARVFTNTLVPYGLWWRVDKSKPNYADLKISGQLLRNINYSGITENSLNSVQQNEVLQTYPQALQSTGFAMANLGKYDEALNLLDLASPFNNESIKNEISAINEIKTLEPQTKTFIGNKDQYNLMQLAMAYYAVKNYNGCIEIFKDLLTIEGPVPQIYSNIGSMYAQMNDKNDALDYFNKALQLNPNLQGALYGKNKLESGD